jgi:hypothetical protein
LNLRQGERHIRLLVAVAVAHPFNPRQHDGQGSHERDYKIFEENDDSLVAAALDASRFSQI